MQELPDTITEIADVFSVMRILHDEVCAEDNANKFTSSVTPKSFPYGLWFRGEGDCKTSLTPAIFRPQNGREKPLNEPSISNHIQARLPALYQTSNPFDRLCLAQHHKIPTRLLDWTESILVATYFAVISRNENGKDCDGILYILNPYTLNEFAGLGNGKGKLHLSGDFGTLFRSELAYSFSPSEWSLRLDNHYSTFKWDDLEDFPYSKADRTAGKHIGIFRSALAVVPARIDQRMVVQGSVFTLHGGSQCMDDSKIDLRPYPVPEHITVEDGCRRQVYFRLRIPQAAKDNLKKQLFWMGIHQGVLFPDMDNQTEFLTTVW